MLDNINVNEPLHSSVSILTVTVHINVFITVPITGTPSRFQAWVTTTIEKSKKDKAPCMPSGHAMQDKAQCNVGMSIGLRLS